MGGGYKTEEASSQVSRPEGAFRLLLAPGAGECRQSRDRRGGARTGPVNCPDWRRASRPAGQQDHQFGAREGSDMASEVDRNCTHLAGEYFVAAETSVAITIG